MNTKMKTLLEPNVKEITNTAIMGEKIIQGAPINYTVGEAISTLDEVTHFSKATFYFPEYFAEFDGYVYERDEIQIFIKLNSKNRLDTFISKQDFEEFPVHYVVQAIILYELATDENGLGLLTRVPRILELGYIENDSEEEERFANLVKLIENAIGSQKITPQNYEVHSEIDLLRMDVGYLQHELGIKKREIEKPIQTIETPEVVIEPVKQEKTQEEVENKQEEPENKQEEQKEEEQLTLVQEVEEEKVQESYTHEELVLLSENIRTLSENGLVLREIATAADVVVSTISDIMNLKRDRFKFATFKKINDAVNELLENKGNIEKAVPKQQELDIVTPQPVKETVVEIKTVAPQQTEKSEEELKALRPLIFDDEAVRSYLEKFQSDTLRPDVRKRFIDAVIAFRKEQREKAVPQKAWLHIQSKFIYFGDPGPLMNALSSILTDNHLIFKGHAGTGKTILVQTISALLNMPLYTMNGSTDVDVDMIIGSLGAANGSTYALDGLLVEAMENAGIIYLDEINMALPEILSVLNSSLDDRKEVHNHNTKKTVFGHKNFRAIGAMNEGYLGTNELNEATANRFISIVVDYMETKHLKEYIKQYDPGYTDFQRDVLRMHEVSEADVNLITNIATTLQNAVKNPQIDVPDTLGSIRHINSLIKTTRMMDFKTAVKLIVQNYDIKYRSEIVGILENIDRLELDAEDILN